MKTVLVTGGSGFIGSHLIPLLKSRGYAVAATYFHELEKRSTDAHWYKWALMDHVELGRILDDSKANALIHLASPSHVPSANNDPAGTVDTILKANVHIASVLAARPAVERILYASSAEVYGRPVDESVLVDERHPTEPRSMYGICKLAASLWLQATLSERIVVIRPFNQIGPGQDPRFAVGSFARQIARIHSGLAEPLLNVGNLDVIRDWVDVRSSVDGHISALERGVAGQVYNLCSGQGNSLRKLVDAMAAAANVELKIEVNPEKLRPGEPLCFVGDPAKLRSATQWQATSSAFTAAADAVREAIEELS